MRRIGGGQVDRSTPRASPSRRPASEPKALSPPVTPSSPSAMAANCSLMPASPLHPARGALRDKETTETVNNAGAR